MPSVHVIGEVQGATDFPDLSVFCKWKLVAPSDGWELLEGSDSGHTQADAPADGEFAVWAHPVDAHYKVTKLSGWLKLSVQVWHQDELKRNELYGYGFCHVPARPGTHPVEIVTWRPAGTLSEEAASFFIGGTPQLRNDGIVVSEGDRFRLKTVTMGKVHAELGIVLKDFGLTGVRWS